MSKTIPDSRWFCEDTVKQDVGTQGARDAAIRGGEGVSSKTSLRRWHLSCYINDAKEAQRRESESGVHQSGEWRKQQVQSCKVETSAE